jgi:hypothetical protein
LREAKATAHEIATYVSQHKLVRVILALLTHPGNADYTVNNSDLNHTDNDGTGVWDHTLPVGSATVRVMKPGYSNESRTVTISAPGQGQPFVPLSLTVDLHQ